MFRNFLRILINWSSWLDLYNIVIATRIILNLLKNYILFYIIET